MLEVWIHFKGVSYYEKVSRTVTKLLILEVNLVKQITHILLPKNMFYI